MALISPILDNRTFEQLRQELVDRIPVYTPEWTNFNRSDPGIALLELFAYLGESLLYRFNQIPDTTKVAFLRMLGVTPRNAEPAGTVVACSTELPEGVEVPRGSIASGGSVKFETQGDIVVWPITVIAAAKIRVADADTQAEQDRRSDAAHRANLDPTMAAFYETAQIPADPTEPGAAPVDISASIDHFLWIAVQRTKTTDLSKLSGRGVYIGMAFDTTVAEPFALQNLDAAGAAAFASPQLTVDPPAMLWELWQGPDAEAAFTTLDIGDDTTRGLTTTGTVEVILPKTLPVLPVYDPVNPGGGADSPPPLIDEKDQANVVAWLRVSRPAQVHINDAIRNVSWIGVNAVGVIQSLTATPEFLGTGDGDTDQRFPLAQRPVLPGTVELDVEETDGWKPWTEVAPYATGGVGASTFTVDYAAGAVTFDGKEVPQRGQRIRTRSYRYGGGVAGNVVAKSISKIATAAAGVDAVNPFPATGGVDPASLADALDEIPARVHRRDRAVIADDFRDLALEVAGVARAETLPLLHPDTPDVAAAGVVSVVVFPTEDQQNPSAPMPDFVLLRSVARYLDVRRLVTTELYVIPPTYRKVVVSAGIQVKSGYQVDAVRRWVDTILRQYLSGLPPLGPDGNGWPLGRTVRRAELEAVAVQVEGVEYMTGLLLAVPGSTGYHTVETVELKRWEMPEIVGLTVVSGEPLPAGVPYEPAPPETEPVPLPPDVC
ncbi:putative baseplate assembly protein [Mycobacterium sp. NPDC004974]